VPHKFDCDKQAAFIEYYEQLNVSLNESDPLLFMDAMHTTQATKITARWIKKAWISRLKPQAVALDSILLSDKTWAFS
jgi:hypothetical protein